MTRSLATPTRDGLANETKWRAHRAYIASGIEWVGEIPSHWRVKRLKYVVAMNADVLPETADPSYTLRYVDIGNVDGDGNILEPQEMLFADAPSRARRRVRHGDTIISTVRTYLKAIAFCQTPPDNLIVSTGFAVLRPAGEVDSKFLYYLARSEPFVQAIVAHSEGVGYPAIAPTRLACLPVWLPLLDEQRAIATFLDHETARIGRLIQAKRRLMKLLEERRAAAVSQIVTKGVSSGVTTWDPGVEFLGVIPSHWEVKRLKFVAELQTGVTLGKTYEGRDVVSRPYLRVANVQDGYLDLTTITEIRIPVEEVARYELKPGDVLMTEGGDYDKLGRGYVWEGQIPACLHQNHIFAVRPAWGRLSPQFLAALMTSAYGKAYFTSTSQQTTNLACTNSTKIRDFPLPLPPMNEQSEILAKLAGVIGPLDALIAKIRTAIDTLNERRVAIISAAVTGKICVSAAEAGAVAGAVPARPRAHRKMKAPPAFRRAVLAAEIVHRLHEEPTLGRVKLGKLLYLCERHLGMVQVEGHYTRDAAGPFDKRMMMSVEKQMREQGWYDAVKAERRTEYRPMESVGGHQRYLDRYWQGKKDAFEALIALMRTWQTYQCEMVATLHAAWNDFLLRGEEANDERIVDEVLTNWNPAKKRIAREKWLAAIGWMRDNGFAPSGVGEATRPKA